jgi:two-component system osmolarity sensor histidine kinase EnvZ
VRTARGRISLAAQTARTLAVAFVVFIVVAVAAIVWFMMVPMARRSAEDLAALMMLSAQTWTELPPDTRSAFEDELVTQHNLWLQADMSTPLPVHAHYYPYIVFLEQALSRRTGREIHIKITAWEENWFWAELPVGARTLRIGFPHNRISVQPPLAGLVVLLAAIVLSLVTARLLARRITGPLAQLSAAAASVGQGEAPQLLPETGPQELAQLAHSFNRMAREVVELLANRTTLLAGISHDLRSPLARMRVALEMLPADTDAKLSARLLSDLDEMNRLIGTFLELARGLQREEAQEVNLQQLIERLAADIAAGGVPIEVRYCSCRVRAGAMALRRVLSNLIENAVRYGEGKPVDVVCSRSAVAVGIAVLDRGPGIPQDQFEAVFRPFHRLETSRSTATGGSGLGLAIARQLADANGWRLSLHARDGGGLEARLELPRHDALMTDK